MKSIFLFLEYYHMDKLGGKTLPSLKMGRGHIGYGKVGTQKDKDTKFLKRGNHK